MLDWKKREGSTRESVKETSASRMAISKAFC